MNTLRLFTLELGRLLRSRMTWLVAALTLISPTVGLVLYTPASAETMLTVYLANPAIAAGAVGAVLFGLLSIYELDRPSRSRVEMLTGAAVSPLTSALVQAGALLCVSLLAALLTALLWLPISMALIGEVFDLSDYALAYLIFMAMAMPLGVLAAAGAYQFTRRTDLSVVLFAAFAAASLTVWSGNWQLCWLNPSVWALSDDFSNYRIFRSAAYVRLTWLAALAGVWTLSWLCVRQYGKGPVGSFARHARRPLRCAAALLLLACSVFAYTAQPFVDSSNPDETVMTFFDIPYLEDVVCTGRSAEVFPDTGSGTVHGTATFNFKNSSGSEQRAAFGVTPGYKISAVKANGSDAGYTLGDYQEYNEALLEVTLPAEENIVLTIEYGGFRRENRNTSTIQGGAEISPEYICLENAALSPRLMNVLPDDNMYPAVIEITLPEGMTAIPFGSSEAEIVSRNSDGTCTWRYEDNGTGGILYAGDYVCEVIEAGGLTIEFYYGRRHQAVMEAAGAADAVRAVVDYCTEHYGPLSFGSGETLKLIQSRVVGGGYATNGASLLDEADFTAANLDNAGKGAGAGEVMIHELVHQWWGLGNMFDNTDQSDAWSAEGLTVYTTYRIVKELYGEDYAREHYIDQWRSAVEDYYLNFYVRNPDYLSALPENERLTIGNSLAYVRQYCEMPLKILRAEELVGGEEAMDAILASLFTRELDPMYPYLTYQDFLDACSLTKEELELA